MRYLVFPLGGYRKTDVRNLASEMKLPAADRPESQEICFVPDNYRAFLKSTHRRYSSPANWF
jgi:tRNA-specific 2-thiouridylase